MGFKSGDKLVNPFKKYLHFLAASEHQQSDVVVHWDTYREGSSLCEQLAPEALSPSCLPKGGGGMKAEPETSIITEYGYKTFAENVKLSSVIQHTAFPGDNSRTIVTVSFRDVTGIKPCPDLSPKQLALTISCGTEATLMRKEDTTPLMRCSVFVLLTPI
ncbi:uncharacterized protein TNCV_3627401 [Trichonephila clavipes]|nr:uncharacterized protein TNCV_3627401 [Trichonephila clavipes]